MTLTYIFRVGDTRSMYGKNITLRGFSTEEAYANVSVNGIDYTLSADVWQLAGGLKIYVFALDDPSQTAQIIAEQTSGGVGDWTLVETYKGYPIKTDGTYFKVYNTDGTDTGNFVGRVYYTLADARAFIDTVISGGCIPSWTCETPLNGYKSDGCGNRQLDVTCNPGGGGGGTGAGLTDNQILGIGVAVGFGLLASYLLTRKAEE